MALPDLEALRVRRAMAQFAERVPKRLRSKLWYTYSTRGNAVTLVENRPAFDDPSRTTEHPFARFRYDPATGRWALWCCDSSFRWHRYRGFDAVALDQAVAEVERDPTGIFLG